MNSTRNFSLKGFSGKLALLQISLSALFFSMFLSGCPNLQASGKSVVAVNLPTGGGKLSTAERLFQILKTEKHPTFIYGL